MIHVFCGKKGSGKTKKIIQHANATVAHCDGSVCFMNCDNSYMYELDHSIRFINTSDYDIVGAYRLLDSSTALRLPTLTLKLSTSTAFLSIWTAILKSWRISSLSLLLSAINSRLKST